MLKGFKYWETEHSKDNLQEMSVDLEGLLWLKTKSILRKDLFNEFLKENGVVLFSKSLKDKFSESYTLFSQDLNKWHDILNKFIIKKDREQQAQIDIPKLTSELYKLKYFSWGGDYKNALDRYLVDKYIKKYSSYDILYSKLDNEIGNAVHGYVLCSWYNHWSSILIENIFKQHHIVLPTVGQIKKVDFFIKDIPFDLKVTYLPENFIVKKRKEFGLKTEIQSIKELAKKENINFDKTKSESQIFYEITEKIKENKNLNGLELLSSFRQFKVDLVEEILKNPKELIQNLYEEQGEQRFDASNRLFLILVDTENFEDSWKLKRSFDLLKPVISNYLDSFETKNIEDLKINFDYKNKGNFTSFSDVLFLIK